MFLKAGPFAYACNRIGFYCVRQQAFTAVFCNVPGPVRIVLAQVSVTVRAVSDGKGKGVANLEPDPAFYRDMGRYENFFAVFWHSAGNQADGQGVKCILTESGDKKIGFLRTFGAVQHRIADIFKRGGA